MLERFRQAFDISEDEFVAKKVRDHEHRMKEITRLDAIQNEDPYNEFTPQ